MIVADTSALISLATAEVDELVFAEFEVETTRTVIRELEDTAEYDDPHGRAAQRVLDHRAQFTVHDVAGGGFQSSRIDRGEASCATLAHQLEPAFLLTDDLRALPELQNVTAAQVALSPIVLRALVKRGALENGEARERLEQIAAARDWLGAPIYRRATRLFEE
ncbi:hypothetical protein [Halosolutus halophilus]|uniref:hypothetical protein n=1 Tax=Halosolutus halophilus TaxID=1552990 RepID=UPI0022350537|nr:hypothetical protein [Halosolutus halophilus]